MEHVVMRKTTLITGGAGYIGSHTALQLIESGHSVLILDNLCNSSREAVARLELLSHSHVDFIEGDIRDAALLDEIFSTYAIDAVLHFAGLKAVAQSVRRPMDYYANNVFGTLNLCQAMARAQVFNLVFSSSATVYGEPTVMPIVESHGTGKPANPYGRSKLVIEELLSDLALADARWNIAVLRYFNPIGAHQSGLIGEAPNGRPNNLLPCLTEVASGQPSTAPVFATTSMCWIWPKVISRRYRFCRATSMACTCGISVPAAAIACCRSSALSKTSPACAFPTASPRAAPVMSPSAAPMRARPGANWAGARNAS
jgi:UDP-glucose 4-epimerase